MILVPQSCEREKNCELSTEVYLRLGFYTFSNHREKDTLVSNLSVYAKGREGEPFYLNTAAKKMLWPLSTQSDTTSFIIHIETTRDTITIIDKRSLKLLSHDCGFIMEFNITDINLSINNIDSVQLTRSAVNNVKSENIKIYL